MKNIITYSFILFFMGIGLVSCLGDLDTMPLDDNQCRFGKELFGMNVAFCTCRDTKCPLNPVNHDRGCTPCIGKCLREGELPSCFFNAVAPYRGPDADYTYQGFAQLVLEAERPCTAGPRQAGAEQMQSPPPET